MFNLALYYEDKEKNYKLTKKYYLMAINRDCVDSINNLALYYKNEENDYEQMKIYYLMAMLC